MVFWEESRNTLLFYFGEDRGLDDIKRDYIEEEGSRNCGDDKRKYDEVEIGNRKREVIKFNVDNEKSEYKEIDV